MKKKLENKLAQRIKSFQTTSGYFEDKELLKRTDKFSLIKFKKIKDFNARRAETRQAVVSLKCINQKPLHPLKFMFDTEEEIRNFIKTLPWNDNPWHSGSHTSHLVIFLETNFKLKREKSF